MIITKVQKDKAKTYSVFIDGEFDFTVGQHELYKLAIYEGRELNSEELAWIKHQARFFHAKNIAISFISYKSRTIYEIKRKLSEAEVEYDIINEVIEYLTESGYVNDEDYARKFAADRSKLSSLSDRMIAYKLREKGISQEMIENVLSQENHSEIEAAKRQIEKKIRYNKNIDKHEIKEFLYKKGFSSDSINSVLDSMEDSEYEE